MFINDLNIIGYWKLKFFAGTGNLVVASLRSYGRLELGCECTDGYYLDFKIVCSQPSAKAYIVN